MTSIITQATKKHTTKTDKQTDGQPLHIQVVLFNKPYGVHSQFRRDNPNMRTLADFFDDQSLRTIGRLDADSEGLLLLTNNGQLNHAISSPPKDNRQKQPKSYLVQVEGIPTTKQLHALSVGVELKDGKTLPANVHMLDEKDLPLALWERHPPIRIRKSIPTSWLKLTIFEGKNRQVRRMTAHVGLPCLRLIRYQVAGFYLGDLTVGLSHKLTLSLSELKSYGINLRAQNATKSTFKKHKTNHKKHNKSPRQ